MSPVAKQYVDTLAKGQKFEDSNIRLCGMLFSGLTRGTQAKRDWLLSLDKGLFEVPFAALWAGKQPPHAVSFLADSSWSGPIDQAGCCRTSSFHSSAPAMPFTTPQIPVGAGRKTMKTNQFSRLVNTREEIRTVARAWDADAAPTLLFGASFSRSSLQESLRSDTGILHIAAHVVKGRDPGQIMIGVGLNKDGSSDFLTAADISSQPVRIGLVSINGCTSGGGASLPGAGLIGLTRAWLLSGATAVAATYWPVNDDRGELFARMYSEIARSSDRRITASKAARTLQTAQIACWRSDTERSRPGYWAAVFVAGKH